MLVSAIKNNKKKYHVPYDEWKEKLDTFEYRWNSGFECHFGA